MDDFNQKQYEEHMDLYLESNPRGDIGGGTPQTRIRLLQKFLPVGKNVFEIGSGGGIDAKALISAGYKVTASDFTHSFVKYLNNRSIPAIFFDAKKGEVPKGFDALYCNAVFVHFSPEEIARVLKKAKLQLQNEKIVFISVIKGEGYERSARTRGFERDFYYYTKKSLTKIIENVGGSMLHIDDSYVKWLQCIVKFVT